MFAQLGGNDIIVILRVPIALDALSLARTVHGLACSGGGGGGGGVVVAVVSDPPPPVLPPS